MSTENKIPRFRSRIVVRLWLLMMALVLFGLAFMWVAQIMLFEQTYIDATIEETEGKLEAAMQELGTETAIKNAEQILALSKAVSGKVALFDGAGGIVALYNEGHNMSDKTSRESMTFIIGQIMKDKHYQNILQGNSYTNVVRNGEEPMALEIGIPTIYENEPHTILIIQSFADLYGVIQFNRNQLITVSVILTLSAAVLAAVLARQFVKPIQIIKDSVDSMAKGDLDAAPNLKLQDELGRLSDSVEELGRALKRVDILRKEVIANVSHELRAPLSLISGYAEMVRDINWKDDKKRESDLNLIIKESGRMSEMVSDILDYSQLQAGYVKLNKDWYNLYDIVESEVTRCAKNAKPTGVQIELYSDTKDKAVEVDALKMSRVIRNLLDNAVNHTEDGEIITVIIAAESNGVRVSIANPGKPIPEDERELIWERYQRSQHQGSRRQGTGIGLSIVSTILKAHGMPYGVDCANGKTVFWFFCPDGQEHE